MSDLSLYSATDIIMLDDRIRGFPVGHKPLSLADIVNRGWKPYDGLMSLPLISLDRMAFASNVEMMMRYIRSHGIAIAPHAKTPMSTVLASALVAAGAWGTTVADIRQASVMLKAGLTRLILANEIGGPYAGKRLASLLAGYPQAEVHIFADSPELALSLRDAWKDRADLPMLGLLVELGAARAGARSVVAAQTVLDVVLENETPKFRLTGIAAYEGSAATLDRTETAKRIADLMAITADVYRMVRRRVGSDRQLIVTAGGSVFFDMVVEALKPTITVDVNSMLVLRSGAIFFHDHGVYERGIASLDVRHGLEIDGVVESASKGFKPALRLWAEVLSRPEQGTAICGMGLRDVAMDQGLPRPLALYRDGQFLRSIETATVIKLNDQHAFVDLADDEAVQIGDVIEFGISHPCTCLDRHAVLYGLDVGNVVTAAFALSFG